MTAPREVTVAGADGTEVYVRCWEPDGARGTVLVVHGLSEHSGRYIHVARMLAAHGFAVVVPDQRGHGRSGGKRTFVGDFEEFLADLDRVHGALVDSAKPWAVWGHSMGGLITLRYLQTRQPDVAGAVISAPWLGHTPSEVWWKVWSGRMIGLVAPALRLGTGTGGELLTRDPEMQHAYETDPLVARTVTPGLYAAGTAAWKAARAEIARLRCPTLFLIPGDDQIVDPEATRTFVRGLPPERTEVVELPNHRHEPHNDLGRDALFEQIATWLDGCIAGGSGGIETGIPTVP